MNLTKEQIKELCDEMPYFAVHSPWTGKVSANYDYSYSYLSCIPDGWHELFLQMCKDIKEPLERTGKLDKFCFTQVKEKYGTLRAYCYGATEEVATILHNYEYVSRFVCEHCGKPAKYVTNGWIGSYCKDCLKEAYDIEFPVKRCDAKRIRFKPTRKHTIYHSDGTKEKYKENVKDIWDRLYKENK